MSIWEGYIVRCLVQEEVVQGELSGCVIYFIFFWWDFDLYLEKF